MADHSPPAVTSAPRKHGWGIRPNGFDYYSPNYLRLYDSFVLGFNNRFVWRCPTERLVRHFIENTEDEHCDIGVGTGYFLHARHVRRPFRALHLVDANPQAIRTVRARLGFPAITDQIANIMQPIGEGPCRFRSISANYLIHCLNGTIDEKRILLENIRILALPGARVFGATIVNDARLQNALSRHFLTFFNARNVFDVTTDTLEAVKALLSEYLEELLFEVEGCVLIFSGRLKEVAP
jgi:hypothetical protein